jgi:DNA-directed RNA polymerase II subunit RPB1
MINDDELLLEQYYEFEDMIDNCNEDDDNNAVKSKWIIRLELDNEIMLEKNITMDDVHFAINTLYGEDLNCVYSDFNSSKLIFRIRLTSNLLKIKKSKDIGEVLDQSDEIYLLRNYQDLILQNTVLRGIKGLTNVMPRKIQNYVVPDEGK